MDLDFERLLIICLLIAVLGGVIGGVSSAIIEHRLFGEADKAGRFRTLRTSAQLTAVAVGSAVGYVFADVAEQSLKASGLVSLVLGVAAGLVAHYVVHMIAYGLLLKMR